MEKLVPLKDILQDYAEAHCRSMLGGSLFASISGDPSDLMVGFSRAHMDTDQPEPHGHVSHLLCVYSEPRSPSPFMSQGQ